MKFCQRYDLIDRHSYVAQYLSLAILTIGVTSILGCDDLLAAFACGTAFAWDGFFNEQTEESVFSSVIDTLFNVAAFIFVGAWMPFGQYRLHVIRSGTTDDALMLWLQFKFGD
jgi:sodium/hydrogen antiporter